MFLFNALYASFPLPTILIPVSLEANIRCCKHSKKGFMIPEHSKPQRSALAEVNAFSNGSEASPQVSNIEWHRINPTPCHDIDLVLKHNFSIYLQKLFQPETLKPCRICRFSGFANYVDNLLFKLNYCCRCFRIKLPMLHQHSKFNSPMQT
jgi:hypothetical protein